MMEDNLQSYTTRFFDETDIFQGDFIKHCKNNTNEDCNIPIEVKNNIKRMAMEQLFYAQVVMLCQNYLKITEANNNEIEAKFKFQGQSVRSRCLVDLDFGWIKEKFSTCKLDF